MVISIADLEEAAALGWRAPDEERLGGWLLRAAGGFTGRANSALASREPGLSLGAAAEAVGRWYRARGLPAMIAVPYPVCQPGESAVDRFLAERGWAVRRGAATVMTAAARAVARVVAQPVPVPPVQFAAEPDDGWLGLYHYRGLTRLPPVMRWLLTSAPWQAFGSIREGGQMIAIGRVAAAGDWAGLTAIEVDSQHRRRGLATVITAALTEHAAVRGVRNVYLQVENDNAPARALYRRLGFTDHHGYHYRMAP